jgi:hypothetical protein
MFKITANASAPVKVQRVSRTTDNSARNSKMGSAVAVPPCRAVIFSVAADAMPQSFSLTLRRLLKLVGSDFLRSTSRKAEWQDEHSYKTI